MSFTQSRQVKKRKAAKCFSICVSFAALCETNIKNAGKVTAGQHSPGKILSL